MKLIKHIFLILAMVAIIFTYIGMRDIIRLSQDPIDLATADWTTLEKGDHVEITIDIVWDVLYSETTTNSTYGVTTSEYESARGYVIPHFEYLEDNYNYNIDHFIGVRLVSSSDYEVVEQILEETNAWYFNETPNTNYGTTTFHMTGIVDKMEKDELELMEEYTIQYLGYNSSEAKQVICPFMIEKKSEKGVKTVLGIGLALDAVLIGVIIFLVVQSKKEKNSYAGSGYMGMDIGGNTNTYGGSNYGGNNYGASNQQEDVYKGPVYGDTSYGGTNSYDGTNTYGQSDTYGGTSTYGQSSTYGGTSTYGQNDTYGGTSTYGQNDTYGGTSTYGQSSTYGGTSTYGQNDTYGGTNTYGQSDTYGGASTYGQSSTYGGTSTYGNSSYGAQEEEKYDGPWQPYQ